MKTSNMDFYIWSDHQAQIYSAAQVQLFDCSSTHAYLSVPVDRGRGEAGDVTPELEPVPLPDPHLPRAPRLYPRCGGHWTEGPRF
jgi:hypothetical protein